MALLRFSTAVPGTSPRTPRRTIFRVADDPDRDTRKSGDFQNRSRLTDVKDVIVDYQREHPAAPPCSNESEMRDDFPEETKRALAARVGNVCSNPDCHASTSGPQHNSTKALNVGVAAHITGAAEGGPRYCPSMSFEERRHPDNGIWLCQTCAKLIDNDALQFPEVLIRAWKVVAEHRALGAIGKTASPAGESESQRKLCAILAWKGKVITHSLMNTGRAVMMIGEVGGSSCAEVLDCTEFYVTVGKTGKDSWSRSIALANVEICFDNAHGRLELQERHA